MSALILFLSNSLKIFWPNSKCFDATGIILTCVCDSHNGKAGTLPLVASLSDFSNNANITRSTAPLGELCKIIGYFFSPSLSTNSMLYLSPFSTSIWSVDNAASFSHTVYEIKLPFYNKIKESFFPNLYKNWFLHSRRKFFNKFFILFIKI